MQNFPNIPTTLPKWTDDIEKNLINCYKFVFENFKDNSKLLVHSIATGCVMKDLAARLSPENKKNWFIAGLMHDIDIPWDPTEKYHGTLAASELEKAGFPSIICQAIADHPYGKNNDILPRALYSADPVTGLVVAAFLILPSKSIQDLKLSSLKKRFKEKRFAAGANREQIKRIEELGINLEEFLELSLEAMKNTENMWWRLKEPHWSELF